VPALQGPALAHHMGGKDRLLGERQTHRV
jgi:hypothetical protein